MIVGGQTEARAQLSSTIIDYHEPFDQGFTHTVFFIVCEIYFLLVLSKRSIRSQRTFKNVQGLRHWVGNNHCTKNSCGQRDSCIV